MEKCETREKAPKQGRFLKVLSSYFFLRLNQDFSEKMQSNFLNRKIRLECNEFSVFLV